MYFTLIMVSALKPCSYYSIYVITYKLTDKQTNTTKNITYFYQGGNKIYQVPVVPTVHFLLYQTICRYWKNGETYCISPCFPVWNTHASLHMQGVSFVKPFHSPCIFCLLPPKKTWRCREQQRNQKSHYIVARGMTKNI